MTLSLRHLRQLICLAEEGNFTRAAERLGLSQPSLSRSIAALESTYGVRLFDRGRLGVALTAAGADVVANARHILGQVSGMEQNLELRSRGEAGTVAFGMGPLAGSLLMARVLIDCADRLPSLKVRASLDTTAPLVSQVLEGALDFCVCSLNAVQPNAALETKRLRVFELGYFVRAAHPLAAADVPLAWEDVAPFPRASGKATKRAEPSLQSGFGPLGETIECDDYEILRQVMLRTDAIWLASRALLEDEIAHGVVKQLHLSLAPPRHAEIGMVRLAHRSQSAAVLRVAGAISAICARI